MGARCAKSMLAHAIVGTMSNDPANGWLGAPEEPAVIVRDDGLKHLPEVRARAFLGLVRAGQHLERRLDADLQQRHGLTLRGFEILLHLAVFSETRCLGLSRLTEQAPLSQSRTSRLVGELEARGLVSRARSADDSRGVDVTLTDRGLAEFVAAQDSHLQALNRYLFSRLSWQEVTQLATITDMVLHAADE